MKELEEFLHVATGVTADTATPKEKPEGEGVANEVEAGAVTLDRVFGLSISSGIAQRYVLRLGGVPAVGSTFGDAEAEVIALVLVDGLVDQMPEVAVGPAQLPAGGGGPTAKALDHVGGVRVDMDVAGGGVLRQGQNGHEFHGVDGDGLSTVVRESLR